MTYSIVARDPDTGQLGIGVQSHFLAVGSIAAFVEPGVGAIATQAFAARQYGPLGMRLLAAGSPAPAVLDALTRLDDGRELRQVGVVDATGGSAAFTGRRCVPPCAHRTAPDVSVQGNMLAADGVPDAMLTAFRRGGADLAARLLDALDAAQAAGGDARGMQSASLLVVGPGHPGRPWDAVLHDERVDDHADPLFELRRLAGLRRAYRGLAAVLFDDGPLLNAGDGADAEQLVSTLEGLAAAASLAAEFGDSYYEPELWRAVMLARHGRETEARELLNPLLACRPSLAVFLRGLGVAGILGPDAAARLTVTAGVS